MTNWTDIHEGFGEKTYRGSNETYQQLWEKVNITHEEAKGWIAVGFEPNGYWTVEQWKNWNFSATETKTWLELGLDKYNWEFAFWLRTKCCSPELVKNNLDQLRNDYKEFRTNNSQVWLEQVHPDHNIKGLNIHNQNLKGELNLSQYQQLEKLDCSENKLTNIILPTSLKVLNLRDNNFNQNLSFLVPYTNLEELDLEDSNFTGSLDYLSGMEQLWYLDISDTDINEVQIDKLPRSLKQISYSTDKRPDCKLTEITPLLEPVKWGWCDKCKEPKTSKNWCQPCAEQKWQEDIKNLTGQELINKFIEQQKNKLKWIPYEKFTDIKHLAEGGFSKIYKAKWKCGHDDKNYEVDVVLKSLNNSNNITSEFLTEIANTKLFDGMGSVVECYGISQDPTTKNYLMVMKYMEGGNLRQYLQNKGNKLSLWDKLSKLENIANGLNTIHEQNLVHQDFHSGNILNSVGGRYYSFSSITDLGLSRPVNHPKQTGQIFGVLPYIAPEVLRGQPYTQQADIYSFGIIAYELLAQTYPYPEMNNLAVAVCLGHRPDIDKVPLPQLLKDLIKRCWDSNPDKRTEAGELRKIIWNWETEIRDKQNTPFYQQYKEIATEYNTFSKNTPYQIYPNATITSRMIDTNEIRSGLSEDLESLRITDTIKSNREQNTWNDIHFNFTNELIQSWTNHNFTYPPQEWINTGLQPTDASFCAWLRNNKNYTSEQVLNHGNLEQLNQEFFNWWQEQQLQAQIQISPK